jgi:hypothetical protein
MRANDESGRLFYGHLRDAYEALELGDRAQAEHSILAASEIDPHALAAVEWWNYLRAESALNSVSESELSAIPTAFDTPMPVEQLDQERATGEPVHERLVWRAVDQLTRMVRMVPFTEAAVAFSVPALLIAFIASYPALRPRKLPPALPSHTVAAGPTIAIPVEPPAPAPLVEEAEDAGPRWLSPRLERLGVLPRWRAAVIGLEDRHLMDELQQSVGELWVGRAMKEHDAIILAVRDASGLDQLPMLEMALKAGGVLWVLHPVNDDTITRQAIKAAAQDANLKYLASTRLTSTAIAEKLVRPPQAHSRT